MLDELAYAGPEHLDPLFVAGFERKQGAPSADADLAALASLGIGPAATVVDLGAGAGQFALPAAGVFDHVVAVDVSPAMLAELRRRATAAGVANLEIVQAGFLSYEHPAATVDAVHSRHALHQLPDFWKALALQRVAAMLRPGGVFRLRDLVYDFDPQDAATIFANWFAGAAKSPESGYTAEDYARHIRTEFSTFRWLLEPMLERAGLEIIDATYEGRLFGTYTCRKR